MNERIKALWSQAGGHYDSGNQHIWPQYTIDNPEKFAELIVKECISNIEVWEKDSRNHISYMLKQHFGVEV